MVKSEVFLLVIQTLTEADIASQLESSNKLVNSPGVPGLNHSSLDVSNEKQQGWSQEALLRSIEDTVGGEIGSSVSWVMDSSLYDSPVLTGRKQHHMIVRLWCQKLPCPINAFSIILHIKPHQQL